MLSQQLHVIVAQPEGVRRDEVGSEHSDSVKIFHRSKPSVRLLVVFHFFARLGEVDVQRQTMCPREFRSPDHHRLAHRIWSVERHRKSQIFVAPLLRRLIHFPATYLLNFVLGVRHLVYDNV